MGLFSYFFGGNKKSAIKEVEPVEYKGYLIYQESRSEGGKYRIAGRITKEFSEGELKTHTFIRSDVLSSESDANEFMLKKSQLFIDQMGDNIF